MGNGMNDQTWGRFLNTMTRRDFIVKSMAVGMMAMVPRTVSASSGEPYRVGILMDTTGPGANYCERTIKGLPLIAAEINKRGGFLGKHPVELYFRDSQAKPDVGTRESRSLILNDKVQVLIGTYSSAVALAMQEIAHERKMIHLAAASNSSKLVHENFTPYSFLFGPDSRCQAGAVVVAVSRLAKEKNWKTYVTIGQDYEWGRDTQKRFIEDLQKTSPGVKMAKEFWSRLGETDYTSYITAIMGMKPDFLFGAMAGKDNETFIQQAKAAGLFKRMAYPGIYLPVTELIQQKDTLPRQLIALARCPFFAHLDNPMMQNYIKLHQEKSGKNDYPDDLACMYFDTLNGLDQAVTKAKSIETEAIRKALTGATIETCRGKLTFRDCNNQLDCPSYVGEVVDDSRYPFPIFDPKTMIVVPSHDVWVPTCEEVRKMQKKRT